MRGRNGSSVPANTPEPSLLRQTAGVTSFGNPPRQALAAARLAAVTPDMYAGRLRERLRCAEAGHAADSCPQVRSDHLVSSGQLLGAELAMLLLPLAHGRKPVLDTDRPLCSRVEPCRQADPVRCSDAGCSFGN